MTEHSAEERTRADLLSLENIYKAFGGVQALAGVSFSVRSGEIHALVGENGAGKSTLIKIATGAYVPDRGVIRIADQEYDRLEPTQSRDLGIAAVYQNFNLLPELSVSENIFLSSPPRNSLGLIDQSNRQRKTVELLEQLGAADDIDPNELIRNLKVSQQQIVEIAKALAFDARVFIMDEPSAVLPSSDLEKLFGIIEALKQEGHGIIYISHRLEEIFEIADRVTVLKDGEWVSTNPVSETSSDELVHDMVGRALSKMFPDRDDTAGEVALEVNHLSVEDKVFDVNFHVREGEIVGMAGLRGSGRNVACRAIVGLAENESGQVLYRGEKVPPSPAEAADVGIVLVPEDRTKLGLILNQTMRFNLTLPDLPEFLRFGMLDLQKEKIAAQDMISNIQIKPPKPELLAESLSGGNQQKIVVGKWLMTNPNLVIFNEPTRGIDVGAKLEIYEHIKKLTQQGVGVIMSSSELPELIGMCDRIIVFKEGRITGKLDREEFSEERIMHYAAVGHE